jgi:Cu-processing system ATP-binding protein
MLMTNRDYQSDAVIGLHGLGKNYGKQQVLQSLDLTVKKGECFALIGHNGAGKTTLLKLILGLTKPSIGHIELWGEAPAIHTARQVGHSLGFLPEAVAFKGNMSGMEVLRFYAQLKNISAEECHQLLEKVELMEAANHKISTYSKGMRQRLGLAQALLGQPQLLVLDEPTSGLDPFFRRKFYQIIQERQESGGTVLLSSHSLTEIEAQTDRIGIMKNGRLVIQGSMSELRQQAELMMTIQVELKEDKVNGFLSLLGDNYKCQMVNNQVCDVQCHNSEKMDLLKILTAEKDGLVQDLDIMPPGLNDLFIHFAGKEEQL